MVWEGVSGVKHIFLHIRRAHVVGGCRECVTYSCTSRYLCVCVSRL